MGIELHTVLHFSQMTLPKAAELTDLLKQAQAVTDAQLHGKEYAHPILERKDKAGGISDSRSISVFIQADNAAAAQLKLRGICRMLNAQEGYGCEMPTKYLVYETAEQNVIQ